MTVLYVARPGAEVGRRNGRVEVRWKGQTLCSVPLREVSHVVLLGPVLLTPGAVEVFLRASIPVAFCSLRARYYGSLAPGGGGDPRALLAQVDRHRDPAYTLEVARRVVEAKVHHARALLLRFRRNHPEAEVEEAVAFLGRVLEGLARASSLEELRGLEGQAAARYFAAYARCIREEGLRPAGRTRRPPRDPANALLSLGYMLVLAEAVGALQGVGLHPALGFLHERHRQRPSLALDLLEPFRQPVVDRLTLSLLNRRVLGPDDFLQEEGGGVLLREASLRRYLDLYERLMEAEFTAPEGKPTSFRRLLRASAEALRHALLEGEVWEPPRLHL